jgi:hypothetical protein
MQSAHAEERKASQVVMAARSRQRSVLRLLAEFVSSRYQRSCV